MDYNLNDIVLLRGFNNYFNRKIRRFDKLSDYTSSSTAYTRVYSVNFNPNDGIEASHIFNIPEDISKSDYMLVLSDNDEIVSRWFIMEVKRERGSQYSVFFKRDVISDNFETLKTSPMFVEKAIITDPKDPFIFNKEDMGYNQIKKNEEYLKDKSGVPWIVGYIARDYLEDTTDEKGTTVPAEDKTITGKYSVLTDGAIPSTQLPWTFTDSQTVIGKCEGYSITIPYGFCTTTVTTVYPGQTTTNVLTYDGSFTISYDSAGNQTGYTKELNSPFSNTPNAAKTLFATDSTKYSIVATNTTGMGSLDFMATTAIENGFGTVPKSILTSTVTSSATVAELLSWNNKVVSHGGKYYKLIVKETKGDAQDFTEDNFYDLTKNIKAFIDVYNQVHNDISSNIARAAKKLSMQGIVQGVIINPVEVSTIEVEMTIPRASRRTHLNDAPYDMFCIPYISRNLYNEETTRLHLNAANIDCDENVSLAIAFYAAAEMGSSVVYDIQLLPFCPCPEFILEEGKLSESIGAEGYNYTYIKQKGTNIKKSICIWCSTSSSSFNIDKSIKVERPKTFETTSTDISVSKENMGASYISDGVSAAFTIYNAGLSTGTNTLKQISRIVVNGISRNTNDIKNQKMDGSVLTFQLLIDDFPSSITPKSTTIGIDYEYTNTVSGDRYLYNEAEDLKVSNECDFIRLSSPNYNGQFEFSVAKNGSVDFFNVDYTYKPFQPYIHINPNFKDLYGKDYNDARGLICGGDFSLPMITSAWTNYQVANKNYQEIFDRQIQNMDTNYQIQKVKEYVGLASGTVTGAAAGALTGAKMSGGNPYATAAGAVLGGAASMGGGLADVSLNQQAYQESRSYAQDMYGYNLGNVQAIPYALSKTSAFTENNKIFPVIESYSCSDKEKTALRNKIKYNGMTVMRIDNIGSFYNEGDPKYIQGELIRNDYLMDDFHTLDACYTELRKGVYI